LHFCLFAAVVKMNKRFAERRTGNLSTFANTSAVADEESRALIGWQDLEVFLTCITYTFQLELTQRARVHNVVTDAVPDGIINCWQTYCAASQSMM
jgi:hypothetical protein